MTDWLYKASRFRSERDKLEAENERLEEELDFARFEARQADPPPPQNNEDLMPLFGFQKPDPMEWAVDGLVPADHLTTLIGDGGTGKSILAIRLSISIATGRRFLGKDVRRGRVLFVDHELDPDEQKRRVARVAEGMGVDLHGKALHDRFWYVQPNNPVGTPEHQETILRAVREKDIDFIVLDSLTMGAAGDATSQRDVVPIMQQIREWPTTVAIDHVSHTTARGSAHVARAFGSVFKRNAARSSLTLAQADTGGWCLQQEKSNFSSGNERLVFAVDWTEDAVTFELIDDADERAAGMLSDLSSKDVTFVAVKDMHAATGEPVHPSDVVAWRDSRDECSSVSEKSVRNQFAALRQQGKIEPVEHGGGVLPEREFA
jgi:KaiC/GvpD/RAD55 family RecA-like ATPase